ncbi:hypothetical protein H4582DRAFT_718476 [Lactarius indigo]|nr:hypothetical protein H4582DRAFT_718476 [Lactarius indigo]
MRRALMAAQQARFRPKRQADRHPTPIITRWCNTQHIHPDKGYTRRIRDRRSPLRLMTHLLPSKLIEELASCHDHRLLKNTPIPVGSLRRHTDESNRTNPPLPPLPASAHTSLQDRPSPISPVSVPSRRTPASLTSSIHPLSLPSLRPYYQQNCRFPHYLSYRAIPPSRRPTPDLVLRHHLTRLCHNLDLTLISEESPSRVATRLQSTHDPFSSGPARVPSERGGVGRSLASGPRISRTGLVC